MAAPPALPGLTLLLMLPAGLAAAQPIQCAGGGTVVAENWRAEASTGPAGTTSRYFVDLRHGGGGAVNWIVNVRRTHTLMITTETRPTGGQLRPGMTVTIELAGFVRRRDGGPHPTPAASTIQSLTTFNCVPPR